MGLDSDLLSRLQNRRTEENQESEDMSLELKSSEKQNVFENMSDNESAEESAVNRLTGTNSGFCENGWESGIACAYKLLDDIRLRCAEMTDEEAEKTFGGTLDRISELLSTALAPTEMMPSEDLNSRLVPTDTGESEYIQSFEQHEAEPIEIDGDISRLDSGTLKLALKSVPKYASKIYYSISDRLSATEAISAGTEIKFVTSEQYLRDGVICVNPVRENEVSVSVFCQYDFPNGESVVSDPVELVFSDKPKKRIFYRIEWKKGGWLSRGTRPVSARLIARSDTNYLPDLQVIYRKDGYIPTSLEDSGVEVLCSVESMPIDNENKTAIFEIPQSAWKMLAQGTALKMVLSDSGLTDYELICEDIASMQIK